MRKIYLDLGANNGETINQFIRSVPESNEFEIFAFEPNPVFWKKLEMLGSNLIRKAVWTENKMINFYVGHDNGSTVCLDKTTGDIDYDNPIKVWAIDFSEWVKNNFSKDDYIIVKMDIEGAEFEVINKLIDCETINYFNEFKVEFHPNKIKQYTTTQAEEFIAKLQGLNIGYEKHK